MLSHLSPMGTTMSPCSAAARHSRPMVLSPTGTYKALPSSPSICLTFYTHSVPSPSRSRQTAPDVSPACFRLSRHVLGSYEYRTSRSHIPPTSPSLSSSVEEPPLQNNSLPWYHPPLSSLVRRLSIASSILACKNWDNISLSISLFSLCA